MVKSRYVEFVQDVVSVMAAYCDAITLTTSCMASTYLLLTKCVTEGKRTLGRPRRRWEDDIKMDLQEMGGGCGDWMELSQDRDGWRALVSTVINLRVPKKRGIS